MQTRTRTIAPDRAAHPDPRKHHCGRCNSPAALDSCACTCHSPGQASAAPATPRRAA